MAERVREIAVRASMLEVTPDWNGDVDELASLLLVWELGTDARLPCGQTGQLIHARLGARRGPASPSCAVVARMLGVTRQALSGRNGCRPGVVR